MLFRSPSIDHFYYTKTLLNKRVIAFNKEDGSNFRVEFNYKSRLGPTKGFIKFGTKTELINESNPLFGKAITIFKDKYADSLNEILSNRNKRSIFSGIDVITLYFEYRGEKSFAGFHFTDDDTKDIILIDVFLKRKNFVDPNSFLDIFENHSIIKIPKVIYEGDLTISFINSIRDNNYTENNCLYPDVKEGVVCKGIERLKNNQILMTKVKTKLWLNKLKGLYPTDFEKLK